ncbi:MAG TPA: FtsW/RodA/SpoVE family cell cycle protein [Caldilineaceae bacterium]|nr:FtsW/RodA/SpoVE family cell cycle protein [Caldilineaceae bacterium]
MLDRQSTWRNFDWSLFLVVLILCTIGIGMIYSATYTTEDLTDYWLRQTIWTVVGIFVMFIAAAIDYRNLEMFALPAFLLFVASLVAVFLFGTAQGGSKRWLDVGFTLIQPTEAGKFLLTIFMAWYLSWYREYMDRLPYLMIALVILLGPLALVYLQPDLGMTITYAFIGGTLILVGGIRYWQLGVMGGGVAVAIPLLGSSLQGYMLERLCMFLSADGRMMLSRWVGELPAGCTDLEAIEDNAYNVKQALIAVGSGDWLGQGWAHGSQNQLHFLRVRHTDFLFSVIAEELGLVGSALIVFMLLFVVWRLLNIADRAQDQFGRLIATGVAAIIFFQTVINIGMNIGIMPVTGLTLPFISYGGSSLLSMMFAIGLAQSVTLRHRKIDFL